MKNFLILIREPDGRKNVPSEDFQKKHQLNWKIWLEKYGKAGRLLGGKPLTLNGTVIKNSGNEVLFSPHQEGEEIIGGYLLINAPDMNDAISMLKECPVYEANGYVEIREEMN